MPVLETQRKWLMNRSLSAPPPTPIHFCLVRRCVPRITVHLLAASLLQEATNRAWQTKTKRQATKGQLVWQQGAEWAGREDDTFPSSSGEAWGSVHHCPDTVGVGGSRPFQALPYISLFPITRPRLETLANLGSVGSLS